MVAQCEINFKATATTKFENDVIVLTPIQAQVHPTR